MLEQLRRFALADLTRAEVQRRAGGEPPGGSDAVRGRLAALLEPLPPVDAPVSDADPEDGRLAGAVIARLGDAASATAVADWNGWTIERTHAALEELHRRLESCGLGVSADRDGRLEILDRVVLRTRPARVPLEISQRLDSDGLRHGLCHLVRGDTCCEPEELRQRLLDLGAAVPGAYFELQPCEALEVAFAAVALRQDCRPSVVEIRSAGATRGLDGLSASAPAESAPP